MKRNYRKLKSTEYISVKRHMNDIYEVAEFYKKYSLIKKLLFIQKIQLLQ
ncbi:hypothetical protein C5L18_000269 [Lactobacillus amylolyticus]|uniref:Uncharacterized protein n=1 Tax=Lactobacillus amylolyticus DSM 11664 TaxID=585524 RepID=D4YRQ1_9LACO|nr:hypothetical protein [Lactobacillus amylolyticus]EFG56131.1 hypothetical protein HMPREF0493_0179 [Lactobacillus amylolyticus DSM 11664]TDG61447.1 hypothetical protein C5L18_000269 [Lactobacillus amylolyticus]